MASRDLTIVLGPPQLAGLDAVKDVLAEWTDTGFVRPFLWWEGKVSDEHMASWSGAGAERVHLLDEVAARHYDHIGIVCALPLTGAEAPDGLPELSYEVEELLARRLGAAQRLSTLGVLIPVSGVGDVPASVLVHRWRVTVVAVDEDGHDPWHASRPVRQGPEHAAHAALSIASAAGLWSGMDAGPFDDDVTGAGQQDQRVRLVRSYVRGARTAALVPEILDATLIRRALPEWMAQLVDAEPARDPEGVVARAAAEFLAGAGARLRRTPHTPLKPKRWRVTPRGALRMLWLFATGRLGEIQHEFTDRISAEVKDRTEKFVQRVAFGEESEYAVRFEGREFEPGEDGSAGGVLDVAQALTEAVDRPGPPRRFADEWSALRALGTGLTDAGPLPDTITPPVFGAHREIVEPGLVSPAPADPDTPTADWLEEQPASLLSRIGRRIAGDRQAAQGAFVGALKRLRDAVAALATQAAPNRTLWYVWLAVAAVCGTGLVTGGVLGWNGTVPTRTWVTIVVSCFVVFGIVTAILMSLHLRTEFQAAHRINRLRAAYEDARREAEHEADELVRLTVAAAEYDDWAPILARFVHPVAAPDPASGSGRRDLAGLPRPWAFGVAEAETDRELLVRLAAVAGRRCFRPSWLSELTTRTIEEAMATLKFERGLPPGAADPDPGTDAAARRKLRRDLEDGAADRKLTGDLRGVIEQLVPGLRLDELFSTAHPVDGEPRPVSEFLTGITAPELAPVPFNRRLWTPASGYPDVPTTARTWLPEAVGATDEAVPVRVDLKGRADGAALISVRLEQTAPIPYGDLVLFACEAPGVEEVPVVPGSVG
jgi:hypothetical protein